MLSLWALIDQSAVEGYAATLVLPAYLAHLELKPFSFASQVPNGDGQEPLVLTYLGEGRLEEYRLYPKDHALAMIRFVCPGVVASRVQLPRDDASWHWDPAEPGAGMRVYFAPTSQVLNQRVGQAPAQDAYVSVSRRHVFIGRAVAEAYLRAWLRRLGLDDAGARLDFTAPSAAIEFAAGPVGGEMFLDDEVSTRDLLQAAGLDVALAQLGEYVQLAFDTFPREGCGVLADGIYIPLAARAGQGRNPGTHVLSQ
jgi:hypothetical protein